jgi:hypothetical protein
MQVGPLAFDVFLAEELLELIGVALVVAAIFDQLVRTAAASDRARDRAEPTAP